MYARRPSRRPLKGCHCNLLATLQNTSSCTQNAVLATFMRTCKGDLANWLPSRPKCNVLLCKISKQYRRNIEPKVAKSSPCDQNARSPLQFCIKVAKTAFWVHEEVFCNVAKRLQWQPFGGLLGGCLAYTHFGRLASI